jgi:hypothetical protein
MVRPDEGESEWNGLIGVRTVYQPRGRVSVKADGKRGEVRIRYNESGSRPATDLY